MSGLGGGTASYLASAIHCPVWPSPAHGPAKFCTMSRPALLALVLACLVVLGAAADKPVKELQIGVKVRCLHGQRKRMALRSVVVRSAHTMYTCVAYVRPVQAGEVRSHDEEWRHGTHALHGEWQVARDALLLPNATSMGPGSTICVLCCCRASWLTAPSSIAAWTATPLSPSRWVRAG